YTSHHLDHFTFGSTSNHSSLDHSSSGHSITGHSLSIHTPPDTSDADSSTPPRFVHPSLVRTLRCSEAYLRWRSAPLSTMYPPTTSESSAGDSSSESYVGPSRKKCRSPATTVISFIHDTRALVPSHSDLLPPHKRDVEAGIDAGFGMEVDVGVDVEDEVEDEAESNDRGTMEVGVDVAAGIDIPNGMLMPDAVERLEQVEEERLEHVEEGLHDIYDHVIEIHRQRIEDIEMKQRELEVRNMIASGERASLLEQIASLERSNARLRGTMMMERARVDRSPAAIMTSSIHATRALVSFDANLLPPRKRFRDSISPENSVEEDIDTYVLEDIEADATSVKVAVDRDVEVGIDTCIGMENMTIARSGMTPKEIEELVNQRVKEALAAYEATRAANALEAKTQSQNGSDDDNGNGGNRNGVVELRRWFEKIETVFHISNCLEKYQVKYATCTLLNSALTWWNSHKRAIGTKAAFAMSWKELMKLMVEVYCQRNEIQKMESELWNQTVKNNDLAAYTQIFQELTMMCTNMVLEEEDRVKKFLEVSIITSKGMQGHNRSDCPKLKDQNCGNKDGNKNGVREARGKAYVLGGGDANPDLNVVKDVSYADKLADGRIFEKNTVLRGCTLGLLDRVNSYGDEVLIVQGDKGEKGEKSKLSIISCTKTQRKGETIGATDTGGSELFDGSVSNDQK
nr:reverse transcriptase domain-containing protein [Tanacetum cinerariifolium]